MAEGEKALSNGNQQLLVYIMLIKLIIKTDTL